ncbi:flagellar basal-body rod protein FlgF [endosymbiont of unidentified scaly snail isolate Monju]|uniref:flagellar basal-body rod protein FlgF n=1 Tax=endosymbiont of unidentified scaly snail isolate Monju TaxID=1248727 RepID=UPI0003891E1E|nr:flagellar basal-body rod protein FlgF [endosymbiont of unidentified scaly snail isolate Monju]BAN68567.1 flagellar basal-body rod protein FlgF [endosymbiont of unidentified scaly snail isolate Monju]
MDRMLYIAMSGARETLIAQGNASNNLANANTTGFLADLNQFRSMPVYGPGHPTRVYALDERPQTDFTHGVITQTGRALDVAVKDGGWIAVQARDGSEAYTRRGDLKVDASGLLVTGNGLPVLGDGGPIALPPYDAIQIGSDGTISIRPQGAAASELAVIDRIKLVAPQFDRMVKGEDGLMRLKDGGEAEAAAEQRLVSGALEASNVNIVNEMVEMIELQRRFEMQIKLMKTAEETASASASVVRPV